MSKQKQQDSIPQVLPKRPERKTDAELDARGFQAEECTRSPEHAYLVSLLESMVTARMWDKLNLSAGQGEELKRLCVEIELLNEVALSVTRDINAGKAAREREAKRLGA